MVDRPNPFAEAAERPNPFSEAVNPSAWEDIKAVTPPALTRGGIAAVTGIPTAADVGLSIGEWLAKNSNPLKWLSSKKAPNPEEEGRLAGMSKKLHSMIAPLTYETNVKRVEDNFGPMYKAQTTPGKYAESILETAPSFIAGRGGLPGLAGRMGRAVMGGAASEGAGQLAENVLPEGAVPYARAAGLIAGAGAGPALTRKLVTPAAASADTRAAADVLKGSGMKLTAGAETGNPWLLQREANLKGDALRDADVAGFTKATGAKAGMSGAERLSPEALESGNRYFKDYFDTVRNSEITPPNFSSLNQDLKAVRKEAATKDASLVGVVDSFIKDVSLGASGKPSATSVVMGMPGGRYQYLRQELQGRINSDRISSSEKDVLIKMKEALDNAMAKELPTGELAKKHKEYGNFEVLRNTKLDNQRVTPEALHSSISNQWGEKAFNTGRGLSPLAQAGEQILKRPAATEPGHLPKVAGAGLGWMAGKHIGELEGPVTGILGREVAGDLVKALTRNPLTRGLYFNPVSQGYLKNQIWQPSVHTANDPAMMLKMLKRGSYSPISDKDR